MPPSRKCVPQANPFAVRRAPCQVPIGAQGKDCMAVRLWHYVASGQTIDRRMDMPKFNERERLADLEARQRKATQDVEKARRALRGRYASIVEELAVEQLSERAFRDIVDHAIRIGGDRAMDALRTLVAEQGASPSSPKPTRRVAPAASTAEPRAAGQGQPG